MNDKQSNQLNGSKNGNALNIHDQVDSVSQVTASPMDDHDEWSNYDNITIISKKDYNSRLYSRQGFYCAIDSTGEVLVKLDSILNGHIQNINEQKQLLNRFYDEQEIRFSNRIQEAKTKITQEQEKLSHFIRENYDQAKGRVEDLHQAKTESEKQLASKMNELGKRKLTLIDDLIEGLKRHLDRVVNNFHDLYEKRFGINTEARDTIKGAVRAQLQQIASLKEHAEKQHQRLLAKMEKLGLDGLNPAFGYWLYVVGIGISIVCGAYFFSVFALSKGISDTNIPFFILEGSANFIHGFMPQEYLVVRLGLLWSILAGFTLLIAFVSWLSWLAIRRLNKVGKFDKNAPKSKSKIKDDIASQLEIVNNRGFSFELRATGGNFLQFWLKSIPFILVFGLPFLISFLTLSKDPNGNFPNLTNLDISLTGAAVGSMLTVLFGALSALYIMKIVEPRMQSMNSELQHSLKPHFELILAVIGFLLSIVSLYFLKNKIVSAEPIRHPGAILIYAVLVFSNGYVLGYALRIRSMFGTLRFLELRLTSMARLIRDGGRPSAFSMTTVEDRAFQKEYLRIHYAILKLLHFKSNLTRVASGESLELVENSKDSYTTKQRKWRFIYFRGFGKSKRPENHDEYIDTDSGLSFTNWERHLFPDVIAEIDGVQRELLSTRERHRKAKSFVREIQEDRYQFNNEIRFRIRKLENSINDLLKNKEELVLARRRELSDLADLKDSIVSDIRQGFELGRWFIQPKDS